MPEPTQSQTDAARAIVAACRGEGEGDERTARDAIAALLATREAALSQQVHDMQANMVNAMDWLAEKERAEALSQQVAALREALAWCAGSADFGEGGQARKGWLNGPAALLTDTAAAAAAHDERIRSEVYALAEAAVEKAKPHTYAGENADLYVAYHDGAKSVFAAIRARSAEGGA